MSTSTTTNPTDILLVHDRWATGKMLEACVPLSDEQLDRPFEMGTGSLHNTVRHMVGAMRAWGDILAARDLRPRIEEGPKLAILEIIELHKAAADDLEHEFRRLPLEAMAKRERGGKVYTFPRGGILTHVTTHAMHHRAQCLNMLRHLGVSPLPQSSVVEWMIANGAV